MAHDGAPPQPDGPVPRHVGARVLRRGLGVLGMGIRQQPWAFSIAVAASAVYGTATVASAWVLGRVADRVVVPAFADGRTSTGAVLGAGAAVVAVALAKSIGIVGRRLGASVMQLRLQASYRRQVTRQYLRLPLTWHARHPTGQLLSNANADVEAMWYPVAPLPMAVGVLVMLAVGAVAIVAVDLVLAGVAFLVFPAIFALNVAYQRRLSPVATRAQQLRAEVSGVAHESFDGALVVKTLGREDDETARFAAAAERLRDAQIAMGRIRGLFDPVLEALPSVGILAVLLIGSARIETGRLDPGELVQAAYLFTLLAFPVRAIGWVLGELPRSVVGWERVRHVLLAGGALPYGAAALPVRADPARLDVYGLRLGYDGTPVLHDVTFAAPAGSVVALVGPTGSGKSTIAALLVRLLDPQAGWVRLDGIDVRDLPHGALARAVALVPQQAFLFDDTVRGNLTLGSIEAGDDQLWTALRLAQADRFVAALPQGLDTRVGERGATLSGGQRQRLALARALLRRPRLLVLDDATSAVDPAVEAAIMSGLRAADLRSTVLVVAHRTATIAAADQVVYVERGRVGDTGPHGVLRARSPGYRRLVTAYERADTEHADIDGRDARDREGVA